MNVDHQPAEVVALVKLGLTDLEAQVYLALLGREAQTAYALARDGGWHKANTYKALESLTAKGAVSLLHGERREWSAVPSAEFLAAREAAVRRDAAAARDALAKRDAPPDDDRVFQLRSADAAIERAKAMLAATEVIVVVDAFPVLIQLLQGELQAAAERGVRVGVRVYEPAELSSSVRQFPVGDGDRILSDWDGQIMALASDGEQYLVAHFDEELKSVRQAFHTASPYLSMMAGNGIAAEMVLGTLAAPGERSDKDLAADARTAIDAGLFFDAMHSPGRNRLARRSRLAERTDS